MVFDLIKSLNIAEKRYFKIFSEQHKLGSKNDYITLFDLINNANSRSDYKAKLLELPASLKKNLSKNKNFLVSKILSALAVYHAHTSTSIKLHQLLAIIKVLLKKKQIKLAHQYIGRAKKLAFLLDDFPVLYSVNQIEKGLLISRQKEEFSKLEERDKQLLAAMEKFTLLNNVNIKVSNILAKSQRLIRNKDDVIELNNTMKAIDNIEIIDQDSFTTKGYYYNIKANYYCGMGELLKENKFRNDLIALHESHPEINKVKFASYISTLSNLAMNQLDLKRYKDCELTINKIDTIINEYKIDKQYKESLSLQSLIIKASLFTASGELKNIEELKSQITNQLNNELNFLYRIAFEFDLSVIYFLQNDFDNSLIHLNNVLNDKDLSRSLDIQYFARILNLLLHFELGNILLLDSLIVSTYRFLLKRKKLYKFEEIIITFIRQRLKQPDNDLKNDFITLKNELSTITQDIFESRALSHFDLIAWLDAKINNKSMAAVLREKAKGISELN